MKEKQETVQPPSSKSAEENQDNTIPVTVIADEAILTAYPEMKEAGAKVGDPVVMAVSPDEALKMALSRIERMERIIELLYHVKSTQVTTPDSLKYKNELDRLVLYKTL